MFLKHLGTTLILWKGAYVSFNGPKLRVRLRLKEVVVLLSHKHLVVLNIQNKPTKIIQQRQKKRYFHFSGPPPSPVIPHRLLQRCCYNRCWTRGITFINHRVEGRLFSPAALLWCAVTVNIKAQSPATPVLLIAKSHSAGACYGWWSFQKKKKKKPEWGGLQSLLVPTNTALWNMQSHCHTIGPFGMPNPESVSYTEG